MIGDRGDHCGPSSAKEIRREGIPEPQPQYGIPFPLAHGGWSGGFIHIKRWTVIMVCDVCGAEFKGRESECVM